MTAIPADLVAALAAERPRLVGLCAHLTGSGFAAEDLAQETLLEAWRHVDRLRDPDGAGPWLSAIARNVCLRWARTRARHDARSAGSVDDHGALAPLDDLDFEADLEREELALLLDRALALLPAETRAVLMARYVEEAPQAQVALHLGLSEGAVAMRLQRGKLALRRVLATKLRAEAEAYGFVPGDDRWVDTQLWCPLCGRRRLRGRLVRRTGEFALRCPDCSPVPDGYLSHAVMPLLHRSSASPRQGAARLRSWVQERFWTPAQGRLVRCSRCERLLPPVLGLNDVWRYAPHLRYALVTDCPTCGTRNRMWLTSLAFGLPEGKQFWRDHPRLRLLPERDTTFQGEPAIRVGFESATGAARLEVLVVRGADRLTPLVPR